MPKPPSPRLSPIRQVLEIMSALRAPDGCPWDREQDHQTLRWHAVEEVYELLDAIDARDDAEMAEELGDLLLQVVFHAQLAGERGAFDFDTVCRHLANKLIRRHPHVFGETQARTVDQVWANWERIKREEKAGSRHERRSVLDGIPRHLPALMRAQKLFKKARNAGLVSDGTGQAAGTSRGRPPAQMPRLGRAEIGRQLFGLACQCQAQGWSAEELLRAEAGRQERGWRRQEGRKAPTASGPESPRGAGRKAVLKSGRKAV